MLMHIGSHPAAMLMHTGSQPAALLMHTGSQPAALLMIDAYWQSRSYADAYILAVQKLC